MRVEAGTVTGAVEGKTAQTGGTGGSDIIGHAND